MVYQISQTVNALPFLAYQKIYYDFFSNSQWEKHKAYAYNVDYWSGTGNISLVTDMVQLRYANYPKDYFMGMLPSSQYGSVSVLPSISSSSDSRSLLYYEPSSSAVAALQSAGGSSSSVRLSQTVSSSQGIRLNADLSALSIRATEYLQRWKEISQSGDSDYREQIRKHFGVNLPQSLSNMCTYIGGISRNLDISEVVNNNLAGSGDAAVIAGKGVGAGNGSFTYQTDEHCVVMCIYHAVPLLDYTITGQDGQLLVTDAESLPIPEFDNIGMEVLPMTQIFNSPKASIVNLFNAGYNPRYFNWKTKLDVVNGAFNTTLKSWVSPVTASLLSGWFGFGYDEKDVNKNTKVVLNYKFFKVNPSVLDPIFGVAADSTWDTDQLLVNSYIGCYVARNLSRDGVPY